MLLTLQLIIVFQRKIKSKFEFNSIKMSHQLRYLNRPNKLFESSSDFNKHEEWTLLWNSSFFTVYLYFVACFKWILFPFTRWSVYLSNKVCLFTAIDEFVSTANERTYSKWITVCFVACKSNHFISCWCVSINDCTYRWPFVWRDLFSVLLLLLLLLKLLHHLLWFYCSVDLKIRIVNKQ